MAAIAAAKAKIEARAKERFERSRPSTKRSFAAARKGNRHQQEAWRRRRRRPRRPATGRPDQSDRRRIAHHEGRGRRFRAMLQRPCGGRCRLDAGARPASPRPATTRSRSHRWWRRWANPAGLNQPATWLADTGYYSEKNVATRVAADIEPLIAVKRDEHHPHLGAMFEERGAARRAGQPCRTDAARAQDQGGRAAYVPQADGGAGVRHHQSLVMGSASSCCADWRTSRTEWTLVCAWRNLSAWPYCVSR